MFPSRSPNWRVFWGYGFEWTPEHLTKEQLRPRIHSYDTLASECLNRLDSISPPDSARAAEPLTSRYTEKRESGGVEEEEECGGGPERETQGTNEQPKQGRRDLYRLLEEHAESDDKLNELWQEVNNVPEWVDWEQIERGQKCFYRYGGPAVIALTFLSLLGGMGGGRAAETLARTGGFGVKVVRRRLLETFQHILQVTRDPDSIRPGGEGFASTVRVRFLHASVRRRILQLAAASPGYYDVSVHGVPVNDLDSAATIATFSSTLVWIGLPRQGIYLRPREVADYLALWRYVAHLLGAPSGFFATPRRARVVMESLLASEVEPTETSRVLANNIILGLHRQPPAWASRRFLCAEAHWLNGRAVADALAIERPSFYYTALVIGQCAFFMFRCYGLRLFPSWEKERIKRLRSFLYKVAVEDKDLGALGQETTFDFEFVPSLDRSETERPGDEDDLGLARGRRLGVVERRNLEALLLAGALAAALAWLVLRVAAGAVQRAHAWSRER